MTTRTANRTIVSLAATFALLMSGAVQGALTPAPFRYLREITTVSGQEEIAALTLDGSSWDLLEAGAPDLRVFNATDAVTPHLLRRATAKRLRRVQVGCPSKVTALRELPDNRIEIDLSLEKEEPTADTIELATPLRDFERRVSVDGIDADGHATRLVTDALIYDYTRFMDVRHVSVELPRNDYRTLRIGIDAVTDTTQSPRTEITRTIRENTEIQRDETATTTTRPFRIDTARLYTHRDEALNRETLSTDYKVKNWSVTVDAKRRTSTIDVETYHTPLTSLIIDTAARNFSRRTSVLVPYQRDGREQWREIGTATLSRIAFRSFRREALAITFPEQQQRRFRIVLHNGDAPALAVTDVRGHGPIWQVLFLAYPDQTYRLLLGSKNASMPTFDTAHIERLLAREIAPRDFAMGPVMDNPDYDAKADRTAWAWLGSRGFFIIGIVLVVAVLGLGLVRAGKTALDNTREDG